MARAASGGLLNINTMNRLSIAWHAFTSILLGKNHVFINDDVKSIIATRQQFIDYRTELSEMVNDNIIQSNLITEAREILK